MKRQLLFVVALALICPEMAVAQAGRTASSPVQAAGTQEKKQLPPKDDINAIGRRNLGGKGLGNWYSLETEISLGKQYSREVEATVRLVEDPVIVEYVNRIAQNVVHNSDAKVPFVVKVIDSDVINALSLPGGFLYVNSGLIMAADGEAELAGVMAHEIAHVAARHATRQMTRSSLLKLASLPLTFVGGGIAVQAAAMIASHATPIAIFKFSRGFEEEADYLGLEYVYAAGYDPVAFVSFLERNDAHEEKNPGKLERLFATHPKTAGRVKKGQEEILRILPPRQAYVVNTSDFDSVKARLLEAGNILTKYHDSSSEPTLRRSPSPQSDERTESKPDSEPPRLQRRDD